MDIVLYSDFTSADCYALNVHMSQLAISATVRWRGVQADPSLPDAMRPFDRRSANSLEDELITLSRRVPGFRYAVPKGKPNTKRAILAVAAVTRLSPSRATALRDAVFHAYWVDGVDISKLAELQRLADGAGVPRWVELDHPDAEEDAENWELDWATERVGGVPRGIRSDGKFLWGLRPATELADFFGAT